MKTSCCSASDRDPRHTNCISCEPEGPSEAEGSHVPQLRGTGVLRVTRGNEILVLLASSVGRMQAPQRLDSGPWETAERPPAESMGSCSMLCSGGPWGRS